jgi:hypothetical protein
MWIDIALPLTFLGLQSGMGSWFRANHPKDSTNGNSWCGYPYTDDTPGIAIDVWQMANNTNPQWPDPKWSFYAKQYCGREVEIINPKNGRVAILYVTDAFDHKWVKSPGSVDIMVKSFAYLYGKYPTDKNQVMMDVKWKFTGHINPKYKFKSQGDIY